MFRCHACPAQPHTATPPPPPPAIVQEVLATVQKREPVQLVREPSNRYDPNAIAVFSLSSGLQLGYVPKESTGMFTSDQICGRVASVGQAGLSGVLGCIVDMRPQLPSLTLPVLPPGMEHCADLSTSGLSQHDVEEVTSGTLAAAGGKCQVTGVAAAAGQALHVVPHWYADLVQRVLWCTGAVAVCAEVHDAMRMLQQPVDARGPAKELMALVNWWSEEEVEAYVRHVVRQQQQLRYVPAELWSVQRWVRPVQQQREGAAVQE